MRRVSTARQAFSVVYERTWQLADHGGLCATMTSLRCGTIFTRDNSSYREQKPLIRSRGPTRQATRFQRHPVLPVSPPQRRSRRRRSAPHRWAAYAAIPAFHHVEAMLQTRREAWYTRRSRVVMRGNPPCCWAVRSPVLCPVPRARRGVGAPAQRIDSRYARRFTRRSTPSLTRMLLR